MLRRLFRPERARKQRPPANPSWLVAGLGNPGAKYAATRHNAGFMVIDRLGEDVDGSSRERFQGAILETKRHDETLVLFKPLTFMNNSGIAVSQVARWYKIPPERILVVYDDLALPFGTIRLRPQGSAGGHNGLQSIIDHLGSNQVPRLRIGIGRPAAGSTVTYVLSRFTSTERDALPAIIESARDAVLCWYDEGIDVAMNRFNRGGTVDQQTGS